MNTKLELEVHEACRELEANGKKVTQRAVQKMVGRGSFSDIGLAIKSYEQAKDSAPPEWVDDIVGHAVRSVWNKCEEEQRATAANFLGAVRGAESKVATMEEEMRKAAATAEEELRRAAGEAQARAEKDAARITELSKALADSERVVATVTQVRNEQTAALNAENKELKDRLRESEELVRSQIMKIGTLEGRLEQLLQQQKPASRGGAGGSPGKK